MHSALIVEAVIDEDLVDHSLWWYARVPSESNPADAPSRGREPEALAEWGPLCRAKLRFDFAPYG